MERDTVDIVVDWQFSVKRFYLEAFEQKVFFSVFQQKAEPHMVGNSSMSDKSAYGLSRYGIGIEGCFTKVSMTILSLLGVG